jgi:hypothetical protein
MASLMSSTSPAMTMRNLPGQMGWLLTMRTGAFFTITSVTTKPRARLFSSITPMAGSFMG